MKSKPKTTAKDAMHPEVTMKKSAATTKPVNSRNLPIDYSQPIVRVSREAFAHEIKMAVKRANEKLPGDMQLQIAKLLASIVLVNTKLVWDYAKEITSGDPLPKEIEQDMSHLKLQLTCISATELLILQSEIKRTVNKLLKSGIKLAIALL